MDPVGPSAGDVFKLNRFAYANSNHIVVTDPTGRRICNSAGTLPGCSELDRSIMHPDGPCCAVAANSDDRQESAKQSAAPTRSAGQCDETCDDIRLTNATILKNQGRALKQAGLFTAKFTALNLLGDGIGRIVGRLAGFSRFLKFAKRDAGIAFRDDTSHIFRNARGHMAEDTTENRALLQGAVKPGNFIGTRGPSGSISVYRETLPDGRQVWVEVRNGTQITNGGVNDVSK
ncbi:hypothetical protein [Rhodanobacter denitrificans]|uniref:hypothetical protein n=1 Tax=Rhodanobacter denitrificans TaxID=666685 RepID=UPI001C26A1D4